MAKLTLAAEPTFVAPVSIPVPGANPVAVKFTFRWRTADELKTWAEDNAKKTDAELVQSMCTGWELDDAWSPENIQALCDKYQQASAALVNTYAAELRGARAKN